MDAALVAGQKTWPPGRGHLGASLIGNECDRQIWMSWRWAFVETFDAATLKRFSDGFRTEALVVERLRMIPGVMIIDRDEAGNQVGFKDVHGHFAGSIDGIFYGVPDAPKTPHILEIKTVGEKVMAKLRKAIKDHGEKGAIAAWNPNYYAQVVTYCYELGYTRAVHVVASAGGRDQMTVRTNADTKQAKLLIERATRLIKSNRLPGKVSDKPTIPPCVWCKLKDVCGGNAKADIKVSCRTCMYSTPAETAPESDFPVWRCHHPDRTQNLTHDQQIAACENYTMHPDLKELT